MPGHPHVYVKYGAAGMAGPGYFLPQVPSVMYFFKGHRVHGKYWRNNPGHPMSPSFVNMRTDEAGSGFSWASVAILVAIHDGPNLHAAS